MIKEFGDPSKVFAEPANPVAGDSKADERGREAEKTISEIKSN